MRRQRSRGPGSYMHATVAWQLLSLLSLCGVRGGRARHVRDWHHVALATEGSVPTTTHSCTRRAIKVVPCVASPAPACAAFQTRPTPACAAARTASSTARCARCAGHCGASQDAARMGLKQVARDVGRPALLPDMRCAGVGGPQQQALPHVRPLRGGLRPPLHLAEQLRGPQQLLVVLLARLRHHGHADGAVCVGALALHHQLCPQGRGAGMGRGGLPLGRQLPRLAGECSAIVVACFAPLLPLPPSSPWAQQACLPANAGTRTLRRPCW